MWRLKQFIPKEQSGLEGKTVEVGSLRLQVRSTIAQGGFSVVYLARDAQSGKQYALKHIICNDSESLDLVKKEVAVMRALKGHPNVIFLHAQSMYDMGRIKECFLVMEHCEKMMVNILDSRNAGCYFEEKQLLLMFRDICNAVYSMHCQSPPIAHRDLKAENVLLGSDGHWKLCDFGSTSTNHKRFETAEEMGIEEDIIRKHTTPAYRAPEMWDLYQRELISEKVDIWALGCLLYRMAYLKSAFDGESKLQILNGNYRLPDLPKFSTNITSLIKDLLDSSPEARPDVMQVWHRVNECLPPDLRKAGPDKAPSKLPLQPQAHDSNDSRNTVKSKQATVMPTRAAPLPPQRDSDQRTSSSVQKGSEHRSPPRASKDTEINPFPNSGKSASPIGAFWSTQYAQDAKYDEDDDERSNNLAARERIGDTGSRLEAPAKNPDQHAVRRDASPIHDRHSTKGNFLKKSGVTTLMRKVHDSLHQSGLGTREDDGYEAGIQEDVDDKEDRGPSTETSYKPLTPERSTPTSDEAFSAFVAEFQNATQFRVENNPGGEESLQLEIEKLRKELKQVQTEKLDIASKYEKLTAICRSQRGEIQELKAALAAGHNKSALPQAKETPQMWPASSQSPHGQTLQQRQSPTAVRWQASEQKSEKQLGSIWDLQEGLSFGTSQRNLSSEPQGWRAFGDDSTRGSEAFDNSKFAVPRFDSAKMGATNGNSKRQSHSRQSHSRAASYAGDAWGSQSASPGVDGARGMGQKTQDEGAISGTTTSDPKSWKVESGNSYPSNRTQPSGWAGF